MLRTALVSMMAVIPAMSFAQSVQSVQNGPLTRAQVIQELVDLESVGYSPASGNDVNYPDDVQAAMLRLQAKRAAEARVAQQQQQPQQDLNQSGYGAQPAQTSEAGGPGGPGAAAAVRRAEPVVYQHH
ncbi:DUF4148 domain-containing protein [Paraburkholderia sp. Ac-20340]|uniref:DUF4148 domain-containing protein n=1 Tax=Paraburkholderia sp. Ac-20340 TaxID=2703888 RepID=UPI0019817E2E|nr:DUF4148 domain-containing protein [Paraburkholderia sp. Ac-20340]MBN3858609.1 DUF4148 domain-containing protein [Paraburkholderia sp. Ac-20340]